MCMAQALYIFPTDIFRIIVKMVISKTHQSSGSLINNSVKSISRIVSLLKSNAEKIIKINNDARPFEIVDLDYLSQGIASIQLEFSRWIVKKYLSFKPLLRFVPDFLRMELSIHQLIIYGK